jgi:hypothetical protein
MLRHACVVLLLLTSSIAHGQLESPRLSALRDQLAPYGSRSLEALRELRIIAQTADRRREIQLATYLLAIGSVDLWIVARRNRDDGLTAQLAEVHGVSESRLPRVLAQTLASVRVAPFVEEVDDALAVLRGAPEARGTVRGDLLFVDSVMRALGAARPVPALARLADDPCPDPDATCPPTLQPFDSEGRRAVNAVSTAQRAAALVQQRAQQGDPLAVATAEALVLDRALLATTELAPSVVGFQALGALTTVTGRGATTPIDAFVYVDSTEVRYAFAPRVAFGPDGARLVGDHAPVLPSFATIPLPAATRAFPEPVSALVELLRSLRGARVAFAPSPSLSTTDLWRVVRSAEAARATLQIAAASPDGSVRSRPLVWREELEARTEVYVRMGGYSVRSTAGAHDLPRVRGAEGWSYDVPSLRALIDAAPTVAVRAMHDMPAAPVIDVLFSADHTLLVRR